ncbi:hypothetical protein IFR05_010998 [Cadophora sp. M221]|nr:hypothetical protein IFR05_010998 [Cadophora sp. M221]
MYLIPPPSVQSQTTLNSFTPIHSPISVFQPVASPSELSICLAPSSLPVLKMATVIGVVGSVLAIFSFLQENFNTEDHTTSETKMRIVAGLDDTGDPPLSNTGEVCLDVRLFNENGGFLGVKYENGCGHPWYASGVYIDGKNPDCIWLDFNGDPTLVTAFQVHFPEFNDKGEGYNSNTQYYCDNAPPFNTYTGNHPNSITYWLRKRNAIPHSTSSATDLNESSKKSKRVRSTIRDLKDDTRLVKSHITTHSAVELCESPTSAGPDFVSFAEGKFCDMKRRIIWDLCIGGTLLERCFDADAGLVKYGDLTKGIVKNYTKILEWA